MNSLASRVRLPVLTKLEVRGFQMYPGKDGSGFSTELPAGINLVLGINGLGKTTLLNAIFRLLSGPVDWRSRPFDKPAGSTPAELSGWKTKKYFSHRVPDGASDASVEGTVSFGEREVRIRRGLSDLKLELLEVDGDVFDLEEDLYRSEICKLSHVNSFDDFYLILRYLVFFLEDRQAVIWDKTAQSDIFRVLFYEPAQSERLRTLFNEIQKLDSDFRNKRGPLNSAKLQLREEQLKNEVGSETTEQYSAVVQEVDGFESSQNDFLAELQELEGEYLEVFRKHQLASTELEELVREYERLEQRRLAELYPNFEHTLGYLFNHLYSGGGCLACGSRDALAPARLAAIGDDGSCPVCESPVERHERVVPAADLHDRRLTGVFNQVTEYRQVLEQHAGELAELNSRRDQLHIKLGSVRRELSKARQAKQRLERKLPQNPQRIAGLQAFVEDAEETVNRIQAKRRERDQEFHALQKEAEAQIYKRAAAIGATFERFASYFLADECTLEYRRDKRRIGQETDLQDFPLFQVRLASGVFHHSRQVRAEPHEVSESQKEFIDLAFRMALIAVACEESPAMIVLETPEASLDAVFILRAGLLLADFANRGTGVGNRLIASSNLNRTEMIPALFGYFHEQDRAALPDVSVPLIPIEKRGNHVIDLLELAEQNTALLEHRESYERKREQALFPEKASRSGEGTTR